MVTMVSRAHPDTLCRHTPLYRHVCLVEKTLSGGGNMRLLTSQRTQQDEHAPLCVCVYSKVLGRRLNRTRDDSFLQKLPTFNMSSLTAIRQAESWRESQRERKRQGEAGKKKRDQVKKRQQECGVPGFQKPTLF